MQSVELCDDLQLATIGSLPPKGGRREALKMSVIRRKRWVQLNLTIGEARKVKEALSGPSVESKVLARVYYELASQLELEEEGRRKDERRV